LHYHAHLFQFGTTKNALLDRHYNKFSLVLSLYQRMAKSGSGRIYDNKYASLHQPISLWLAWLGIKNDQEMLKKLSKKK
jgi:hypothetical protein